MDALLKLIKLLLAEPNTCLKTKYCFQKYFKKLFPHLRSKRHYYYALCSGPLTDNDIPCHGEKNVKFFIMSDLEKLLMQVKVWCVTSLSGVYLVLVIKFVYYFLDTTFWKHLKKPRNSQTGTVVDISGGKEYKLMLESGGFSDQVVNPANITVTLNTDGVAIFRSSSTNIWPLLLIVNELPPVVR